MSDPRTKRGQFFLIVAVIGAVAPYAIILPWFSDHGLNLTIFFGLPFASRPAAMFSIDVLLSVAVFLVWAEIEARQLGMRARWQPLVAIILAGLCCSLPLFLARREWAMAQRL